MIKKHNKKGNFVDIPEFIRTILILGFVLSLTGVFIYQFNNNIQSMDNETIPEVTKNASAELQANFVPKFDFMGVFITLFFVIISVVAARLIPSSPKFIIIAIFAMILLGFVAMIIENVWDSYKTQAVLTNTIAQMKFTTFILDNLTAVVVVYSLLVGIALFTKTGETL